MSSIINALLVVGLLFGGVVLIQNRCSILGLSGEGLFGTASAASAPPVTVNVEAPIPVTEDGIEINDANQQSGATGSESTYKCCHCKHMDGRVKCERNGDGKWFNPPAGSSGSNDQDLTASANECSKGCGGSTTTPSTNSTRVKVGSDGNPGSDKVGVQNKNNSVTGSGQKINPPKTTSTGKPNPYASYVNANPGGYKPGGGSYFAQAYYNSIRRNNTLSLSLNGYKLSSF